MNQPYDPLQKLVDHILDARNKYLGMIPPRVDLARAELTYALDTVDLIKRRESALTPPAKDPHAPMKEHPKAKTVRRKKTPALTRAEDDDLL